MPKVNQPKFDGSQFIGNLVNSFLPFYAVPTQAADMATAKSWGQTPQGKLETQYAEKQLPMTQAEQAGFRIKAANDAMTNMSSTMKDLTAYFGENTKLRGPLNSMKGGPSRQQRQIGEVIRKLNDQVSIVQGHLNSVAGVPQKKTSNDNSVSYAKKSFSSEDEAIKSGYRGLAIINGKLARIS